MLIAQSGRCAVCFKPMSNPQIDHSHENGANRELLCKPCNTGLGNFGDSVGILESAIAYLRHHEGKGA